MQTTSHLLMIKPVNFTFNEETAINNAFQVAGKDAGDAQEKAAKEFDDFVTLLQNNGIEVTVVEDTPEPFTPDSIFPNNWISFHSNGTICLYPMFAENRRLERRQAIINLILSQYKVTKLVDFSFYENEHRFLEGTGSMVLDRENKIAYACISPRTEKKVLQDFCKTMGYKSVAFEAMDANDQQIYHTNVMMCVADKYVVICLKSIKTKKEKDHVIKIIKESGKKIIDISMEQMNHFAGNMLQVENHKGEKLLIMSTQAFKSLKPEQLKKLNKFNKIIHSKLNTIETNGGGSARCMLAEIHLRKKAKRPSLPTN
jgi:hypothetical protein